MDTRFHDQIAVVTGAASGIGRGTAHRFMREGARVLAVDRDETGLDETVRQANGPGQIAPLMADVAEDKAPDNIAEACVAAFGPPKILINNAGVGDSRPVHDSDDANIDRFLDVNLRSLIRISRRTVADMQGAGQGGVIINLASVFGITGFRGSSVYSATKAAVIGLTRNMAADYGPKGIRVNAIAPGIIETPLTQNRLATNPWFKDTLVGGTPLGRTGTPDDIAAAIAFLCSDDASYITGQTLVVDGGFSATHFRPQDGD